MSTSFLKEDFLQSSNSEIQANHNITKISSCSLYQAQGCQMVYFQTKNRNLGTYWRDLQRMILVYFMNIWSILQPFDTGIL
jgi:hypothetical protein